MAPEACVTDIPVIDIADLASGDPAARAAVARQLGDACRGVGFFYIAGHGIPHALTGGVFAEARRFFALPDAQKAELSITRSLHNRGYVAMAGEHLQKDKAPDLKEAFNIGFDLAPDHPDVAAGKPFRGVNLWPGLEGWRETVLAYYNAAWTVGRMLHRGFAIDLGLPDDFFEDKLDFPIATLRLLHYPPYLGPEDDSLIGAGTHCDYGNVTILRPDGVAGLQIQTRDGVWIDAPTIEGTLICNIGYCLMRWTNDTYVSTPHRVQPPKADRYSIAFFLVPNPDAEVAVLPTCQSAERPARYAPIQGAPYLKSRLDATYEHRRTAAE